MSRADMGCTRRRPTGGSGGRRFESCQPDRRVKPFRPHLRHRLHDQGCWGSGRCWQSGRFDAKVACRLGGGAGVVHGVEDERVHERVERGYSFGGQSLGLGALRLPVLPAAQARWCRHSGCAATPACTALRAHRHVPRGPRRPFGLQLAGASLGNRRRDRGDALVARQVMTRQVYASFGANLALNCRKSLESRLANVMHDNEAAQRDTVNAQVNGLARRKSCPAGVMHHKAGCGTPKPQVSAA